MLYIYIYIYDYIYSINNYIYLSYNYIIICIISHVHTSKMSRVPSWYTTESLDLGHPNCWGDGFWGDLSVNSIFSLMPVIYMYVYIYIVMYKYFKHIHNMCMYIYICVCFLQASSLVCLLFKFQACWLEMDEIKSTLEQVSFFLCYPFYIPAGQHYLVDVFNPGEKSIWNPD